MDIKHIAKKFFPFLMILRVVSQLYSQKYAITRKLHILIFIKRPLNSKIRLAEKKFIFIHIPKTAGTSFRYIAPNNYVGHWRLSELEYMKTPLGGKEIVACVRNPYDRLLSCYKYLLDTSDQNQKNAWGYKKIHNEMVSFASFEDFVKNIHTFKYKFVVHFDTQYNFIKSKNNHKLTILKYENLNSDLLKIQKKHNLHELPHTNQSKNVSEKFYTTEIANIVYGLYQQDFEYFGFDSNSWKNY